MKKNLIGRNMIIIVAILIAALIIFLYSVDIKASGPADKLVGVENDATAYTEVRASHILVETEQEALDIEEKINGGFNFSELAKEYSLCPSGQNGGDLDWFGKGVMVLEFEQAAFDLDIGEVSEPVQTQFGWHIILLTGKR